MKLSELAVRRPVTILMMIFIVLILGFVSFTKIPLDLMPEMEIPVAVVSTSYPGVGPQEMEKMVTVPLEEAIGTTENIKSINSISSAGSSMVIAQFEFGTDMESASLELRERIDMVKGFLPEEAGDPMVFKFDPSSMPVMMLSLSSDRLSLADLQALAENTIKPRLQRAEGVARIEVVGGLKDVVEIKVGSDKLQGYGIGMDYIANILRAENLSLPAGEVKKGAQKLTVKTGAEFKTVEEIEQLVIPLPSGTTVALSDLAEVNLKSSEPTNIAKANGKNSIDLMLSKQSGSNTVKVSEAALKEIERLNKEINGTQITVIYDTADYIKISLKSVYNNAWVGGILAIFILYLFLRNLRTTLIIAVSIPISIIATFCLVYFSGVTLNLMTIGGLALGVGMLVDNSIVVLENIYRFRSEGTSQREAAVKAASEVSLALMASTCTTLAVFLPIVFVQGLTSTIFKQLAMTVSFSLAASLVVALTLVPMLSSKFLKVDGRLIDSPALPEKEKKPILRRLKIIDKIVTRFDRFFQGVYKTYGSALAWTLQKRKRVIAIAFLAFIGCLASIVTVGTEFFPDSDEGFVQVSVTLPEGADLKSTVALLDEIEAKMKGIPEIDTVFLEAGYSGNMMSSSTNSGVIYVKLLEEAKRERDVWQITDEIRSKVQDTPGAKINVSSMGAVSLGSTTPISISIYGEDLETLKEIGADFVDIVQGIEGTREVKSSYQDSIPEVEIGIDRLAAAQYGLTTAQIAQGVKGAVSGSTATKFKKDGREIDIILKGDEFFSENIQGLEQIPINTSLGFPVALEQVADISIVRGPISINRADQERMVTVSSQIAGRDVGSISKDIQTALAGYQMPDKYSYEIGGEQQEMVEAFSDLGLALVLAVVLVYMVMAAQFESLLYPFIVMFSMPLGFAGGIFGLFVTGTPLSVPALIGLIMLAGIVVNNGIVLVDYINIRRRVYKEDRNTAITKAGAIRLRPILMTTLTTVLGMIPLSLGLGEGATLAAPLAIVVVWGLALSTLVTLLVIPVLYTMFDDLSAKVRRSVRR
ncbi:MAG: efflux RND transporter permease subunit [Desulfitobacteriia bacterium]